MESLRPRRHSMGATTVEGRPFGAGQHQGDAVMAGVEVERASVAATTLLNEPAAGPKEISRADNTRTAKLSSGANSRPSSRASTSKRRFSSGRGRRRASDDFSFAPYAPMMFSTGGGSTSVGPRPRRASAPAAASPHIKAAVQTMVAAAKAAHMDDGGAGPTLEQCLVLPKGLAIDGIMLHPTAAEGRSGGDGGARAGVRGGVGVGGVGANRDDRAILSNYSMVTKGTVGRFNEDNGHANRRGQEEEEEERDGGDGLEKAPEEPTGRPVGADRGDRSRQRVVAHGGVSAAFGGLETGAVARGGTGALAEGSNPATGGYHRANIQQGSRFVGLSVARAPPAPGLALIGSSDGDTSDEHDGGVSDDNEGDSPPRLARVRDHGRAASGGGRVAVESSVRSQAAAAGGGGSLTLEAGTALGAAAAGNKGGGGDNAFIEVEGGVQRDRGRKRVQRAWVSRGRAESRNDKGERVVDGGDKEASVKRHGVVPAAAEVLDGTREGALPRELNLLGSVDWTAVAGEGRAPGGVLDTTAASDKSTAQDLLDGVSGEIVATRASSEARTSQYGSEVAAVASDFSEQQNLDGCGSDNEDWETVSEGDFLYGSEAASGYDQLAEECGWPVHRLLSVPINNTITEVGPITAVSPATADDSDEDLDAEGIKEEQSEERRARASVAAAAGKKETVVNTASRKRVNWRVRAGLSSTSSDMPKNAPSPAEEGKVEGRDHHAIAASRKTPRTTTMAPPPPDLAEPRMGSGRGERRGVVKQPGAASIMERPAPSHGGSDGTSFVGTGEEEEDEEDEGDADAADSGKGGDSDVIRGVAVTCGCVLM